MALKPVWILFWIALVPLCTRASEPTAGNPSPEPRTRTLGLGYFGWQESANFVRASDSASFPMHSFQSGWSIDHGREFSRFGNWSLDGHAGLFACSSALMNSSAIESSGSGLTHRTTNARALGGWVGPELAWSRGGRDARVGLLLPVLYRKTNWPDASWAGNEYRIQGTSRFLVGALLTYGLRREPWEVSTRMGFFAGSSNLAWMVGVSRVWSD